jgi:hypothetical protein
MAIRYAVATGNWSSTSTWNGGTLPTSADDVYANGFTVTIDQNVTVLSIRTTAQSPAIAGGSFTVSGNFTITASLYQGTTTCLTYTGTGTLNIVGNIPYLINQPSQNTYALDILGNGNINMVGSIYASWANSRQSLRKNGSGNLTITGDIEYNGGNALGNEVAIIVNSGNLYITGNLNVLSASIGGCINYNGTGIIEINGTISNACNLTTNSTTVSRTINISSACILNHVGTMNNSSNGGVCAYHTNAQGSIIASGPFISAPSAMIPFVSFRFFYRKTFSSYYEFRDSSTNGALPPATAAPATRLVSPDTVVDAPIPANVRQGVSYALGTFTGTLKVPLPSQVSKGIQTDNTIGTAALTPEDVWNALTSSMTTAGSIGKRLKDAATVQSTGDQIAAL